jgi:hypothetical protein
VAGDGGVRRLQTDLDIDHGLRADDLTFLAQRGARASTCVARRGVVVRG